MTDLQPGYDLPMTREDDQIRSLLEYNSLDAFHHRRASIIDEARRQGWTWEEIAEVLGMSPAGVQRAPYVSSPWNEKKRAREEADGQ